MRLIPDQLKASLPDGCQDARGCAPRVEARRNKHVGDDYNPFHPPASLGLSGILSLWQAANPVARDFRLEAIGPAYRRSALEERGDGVYIAKAPEPAQGWVAYFIELTFPSGGLYPFKFTTGVQVAPDVLPFGPPPEMVSNQHSGDY